MKLLDRKDIDIEKWDRTIAQSPQENIFCYSWYLDAVADQWAGLVSDSYSTILCVPYSKKLGVKQFYNAPFCREYAIFGDEFGWTDALSFLSEHFKAVDFRCSDRDLIQGGEERVHQQLKLSGNWRDAYRTNAKRIVKKTTDRYSLLNAEDPTILIDLFKEFVYKKISTIQKSDLEKLTALMLSALDKKSGELLLVLENEKVVAGGFFLLDKNRVTYLKGASSDQAKNDGAMYYLLDEAMKRYQSKYSIFDFGGSDVENVANFYHKFGAIDHVYYRYQLNNLPTWFKALKKLKR